MIVVTVQLVPHGIGTPIELGRMVIANDATQGNGPLGNYVVKLGRKGQTNSNNVYRKPQRAGVVKGHKRLALSVWVLVAKALASVGFNPGSDVIESSYVEEDQKETTDP